MGDELVSPDFLLNPTNFEEVFLQRSNFMALRNRAIQQGLTDLGCRFLAWKLFLGILPEEGDLNDWLATTRQLRADYQEIVSSITRVEQTKDLDPVIFNPLSPVNENPWNSFHENNELKDRIRLDVERTYQEKALFQLRSIQDLMTSVLFIWAKENPHLSYKQGMNELLGILLYIAFAEKAGEHLRNEHARELYELYDPEYIEADLYWVFARLMSLGIKELFNPVVGQRQPQQAKRGNLFTWSGSDDDNELVGQDKTDAHDASSVLKRCHRIHHRYLQAIDSELYNHLEREKIEPQMYLQRWLRCVLSREFNLADTLVLWDSIFACVSKETINKNQRLTGRLDFNKELVLLDFICVGMLVFVRTFCNTYSGLQSDCNGILRRLLKYPPVEDISSLVNMGISYKEYILGGCVTAKPQVNPVRRPMQASTQQSITQNKSLPLFKDSKTLTITNAPLSQPQQPRPQGISHSFTSSPAKPVSQDPLAPQRSQTFQKSSGSLPSPNQGGNALAKQVNDVIDLLQGSLDSNQLTETRVLRAVDMLKEVKQELMRQAAKRIVEDPLAGR